MRPYVARRRRATDRLERDRTHERAARAAPRRRAGAHHVARARRLAIDGLRHRGPPQGDVAEGVALAVGHVATRRGNRLGVITFGGPADPTLPPAQGRHGLSGFSALEDAPEPRPAGLLGRLRAHGRRAHGSAALSSWSRTSAARSTGARRCASCAPPRRARCRDPRPARAGAARRRRGVARRSGDRPPGPRRYSQRRAARALRDRRRRRAERVARALRSAARTAVLGTEDDWLRALVLFLRGRSPAVSFDRPSGCWRSRRCRSRCAARSRAPAPRRERALRLGGAPAGARAAHARGGCASYRRCCSSWGRAPFSSGWRSRTRSSPCRDASDRGTRDRRLALDGGEGRAAVAAVRRGLPGEPLPDRDPEPLQRRSRRVRQQRVRLGAADAGPQRRPAGAYPAAHGGGNRDRRRRPARGASRQAADSGGRSRAADLRARDLGRGPRRRTRTAPHGGEEG